MTSVGTKRLFSDYISFKNIDEEKSAKEKD
jgi:hypothetical protein